MEKIGVNNNTALAIFFVATAIMLIGGSAMMMTTTTQTAEAARNCDPNPDGGFTCTGGSGGHVVCNAGDTTCGDASPPCDGGLICSGGSGGRIECDAEDNCVNQGGFGRRVEDMDEPGDEGGVGGGGHRITGDSIVGGSGQHDQGPGGNSGR